MHFLRALFSALLLLPLLAGGALAQGDDWNAVLARANGQTVYFNAWGGSDTINAYIAWAGRQVETRFGVALEHVKLGDTAEAVSRVLAEKTAGRTENGTVDLIWLNGENFAAMKRNGLLRPSWAEGLPNYHHVDVEGKPTVRLDFTIPVEGQEAPWGMAQFVFIHDSARLPSPPRTIEDFVGWAKENPGRFTYPQPPNFTGSSFLKQALVSLADNREILLAPAEEADAGAVTAPLWAFLDALHPHLWRSGKSFPANGPAQRRLLSDGAVDIAMAFNPAVASNDIAKGLLPESVRTYVLEEGTIGNTHFVTIPFNANAPEGAMVVADFLMSPEAQWKKQDPEVWGDFTVLDVESLPDEWREAFRALPRGVATLSPEEMGTPLPEPHPSWMTAVEQAWQKRYSR